MIKRLGNRANGRLINIFFALVLTAAAKPATADLAIEPYERRPIIQNQVLEERLKELLPTLMRESDIDMWIVVAREYNDDPVFLSLVPKPRFTARRTTMLVFFDRGSEMGLERLTVSRYPLGSLYDAAWEGGDLSAQWQKLGAIVRARNPQKIAVNVSDTWPVADGLSHSLFKKLESALEPELRERIVSAERLVVRWMETRTSREVELWQRGVAIARETIASAFSSQVITPGVTTLSDVAWFIRTRFEERGLEPWFHPDVNRQWQGATYGNSPFLGDGDPNAVIHRGDVLHTDVGLCYLGLCTDTQEMGYVLKLEESEPPAGLVNAMRTGTQWQDLLTQEFVLGRSGNEILAEAKAALSKVGIRHAIYTHPLGFYGHAPGPTIGMWDNQGPTPIRGDWPLHAMTGYAIEGNVTVKVPEWLDQAVQMKLEQSAIFDGVKVHYLAGRQKSLHIIGF